MNKPIEMMRKLIKIELDKCSEKLWAQVCEMKTTPIGYERLEKMILERVANEAIPISTAIALIEHELSHTSSY